MRRRITWLVAATTSAIVLAFVVPLCLLVRSAASERALAEGNQEARAVALLVSGLHDDPRLAELVEQSDRRSAAPTTVLMPNGRALGTPHPDLAEESTVAEAAGGAAFTHTDSEGAEIFVPVVTPQGTSVVATTVSRDLLRSGVYRAWAAIAGLGALLLLVAVLIADRLGRRISVPVTDLADVAERLHQGDLGARARPQGPEETVELAETVNRLADRIVELLATERAAVGDLSHRLRTPVTALRLDAETVADEELSDRLQSHIEQLQVTIDAIVRDARRPLHPALVTTCDAVEVTATRAAFWSALAEDTGREVHLELPEGPLRVSLDAAALTDVLDVLVDNVFAHTPDDSGFTIRLLRRSGGAVLEVADEGGPDGGGGSTDRVGSTGLGLKIVRRTAASAGGHLSLQQTDAGLVARVTLPPPPG